jgi:c-di-GMP-binding flagellar brake protein YcgR
MDANLSQRTQQQRRYLRAKVDLPVTYQVEGEEGSPHDGCARDLGGGGLRLETSDDLPQGTVLTMRFSVPSARREMMMRGRIVLSFFNASTKQYGHGIAFTQIAPDDQEIIVQFVHEYQRMELQGR